MIKLLLPLLLLSGGALSFFGLPSHSDKIDTNKDSIILAAIINRLTEFHYEPETLNDAFSTRVYSLYLKRIDPAKRFFLASDIDSLKVYQNGIDEQVKEGSLAFLQLAERIISRRTQTAVNYYKEFLAQPFDYNVKEFLETDGDKINYVRTEAELKERWRLTIKQNVLDELIDVMNAREKSKAEGKEVAEKTFEELEAEARQKISKRYDAWAKRLLRIDHEDRLSEFLNALTLTFDPHTNYFPPEDKEDFDISMSGKWEGIGARLMEEEGGFIKVIEIIPGSPSWQQGELKESDLIMKVAQGADEPVDVVNMKLRDVVKLIRGKKGTEVRLTVKKADGSVKIISITRDVVEVEEGLAKSAILEYGEARIGLIYLPQFYADFNDRNGHHCARDVEKELIKLKQEGVDGIILDLRGNGGGSLQEVVDMTGLFIERGPVVQVKTKQSAAYTLSDDDPSVTYSGPLAVMVNSYSASASEILAAAIQDYKRGVVIGSASTFGKGTVQRFVNLDELVQPSNLGVKPLGQLKLTTQKFYRINGGTTQLEGVKPDIILPDVFNYVAFGEREEDYPMEWNKIDAAKYKPYSNYLSKLENAKKLSEERVKEDEKFRLLEENALFVKAQRDNTRLNLHLEDYKTYRATIEAQNKKVEKAEVEISGMKVKSPSADATAQQSATEAEKAKLTTWHKDLQSDVYLMEAINILCDLK